MVSRSNSQVEEEEKITLEKYSEYHCYFVVSNKLIIKHY